MTQASFRAIAIRKAKLGQERALLDFAVSALREIRKVDGLFSVEVSQSVSEAELLRRAQTISVMRDTALVD